MSHRSDCLPVHRKEMNYSRFTTPEALIDAVLKDVQPEWLEETTFGASIERVLRFLHDAGSHSSVDFLPQPDKVLEAFKYLKPVDVRVIITAQDPYPDARDAMGIAFHSPRCPRSAQSINKNLIAHNLRLEGKVRSANYMGWVHQGVLMTNRSLTTAAGKSNEHAAIWMGVIEEALRLIPSKSVVMLLGEDAKALVSAVKSKEKVVAPHPVARDNSFADGNWFGEVNASLRRLQLPPIDWNR